MIRVLCLLLLSAPAAWAQDDFGGSLTRTLARLRDSVGRSVVAIEIQWDGEPVGGRGRGAGVQRDYNSRPDGPTSGTLLTSDGYIITSAFNLSGPAQTITVTLYDGRQFEAKRLGSDSELDIALLKIEASGLPVLPRADLKEVRQGVLVAVLGRSPDKYICTIDHGIVSAVHRFKKTAMQVDAAMNYGNAGGPLVTMDGKLLGIASRIRPGTQWGQSSGVGFATKMDRIDKVFEDLKTSQKAEVMVASKDPWTGILTGEPTEGVEGVTVDQVLANSPAEEAGLERTDVITAVDGKKVATVDEFREALRAYETGTWVQLTFRRQNRAGKWIEMKAKVKLIENPIR